MITPKLEDINSGTIVEKYIKKHFPEFHSYIIDHYPADLKWTEKLYWYYHNIKDCPRCLTCNKKVKFINFVKGYKIFCSDRCSFNSDYVRIKKKNTWIEKYGVENPFRSKEVLEKRKNTWIEKYGVENPTQNPDILNKRKRTWMEKYGDESIFRSESFKEKRKQTLISRYGVGVPCQNKKILNKYKQTCLERFGVENPNKNKEVQQKQYLTKKSNHSFNNSKIEEDFAGWLSSNNISFIRQYRSDKYPFACDFYFPEKDLYLEIQGMWTHGDHPFNPNNESDKIILEEMQNKHTKYYNNAIRVWTVADPLKRGTAKKNGLNWVEVFSCKLDDVVDAYNNF